MHEGRWRDDRANRADDGLSGRTGRRCPPRLEQAVDRQQGMVAGERPKQPRRQPRKSRLLPAQPRCRPSLGSSGVELSGSQRCSRTTEFPSDSDDTHTVHQTLQSLWTQCCSNVTGTTRHDHGQDSIGSLSNLGVCLLRPPRYQPRLFLAPNWGADLRRRPRHDPQLGLTPSRPGQLTVVR